MSLYEHFSCMNLSKNNNTTKFIRVTHKTIQIKDFTTINHNWFLALPLCFPHNCNLQHQKPKCINAYSMFIYAYFKGINFIV